MSRFSYLLLALALCMTSCFEKGEIRQTPEDFIQINGKVYKLMSIVPREGNPPIWILYPKDSTDTMPVSINYHESKTTKTIIKVD